MELIIIAAIGKNNELGKNNNLIWHLTNDLKFFKENTSGYPIIMGYNTFKSLPKLLPNRKHIILTHKNINIPDIDIYHDKESLLKNINKYGNKIFIIGGSSIYKEFLEEANTLLLTEINATDKDADVFFPKFDKNKYIKKVLKENKDNNVCFVHVEYKRISN